MKIELISTPRTRKEDPRFITRRIVERTRWRNVYRECFLIASQSQFQLPAPDCWKRTPLHEAVKNNHAEVVKLLIRQDTNIRCSL
ncbi:hypothetical protein E2986_12350 [Frieseomelitta varia]|uniref:Uncharacterized protein n=1 Tax=Frieseomelitta varia TaxID=561572 RepID=A0A833RY66_9HYME|nr:hypothetical protein E2986_12350 [Frieseomelitta varia]